jgi:hypothetical protein
MSMQTPRFTDDDQAGQYWLGILQAGDPVQSITARTKLARVFERRGMLAEAVELLESNARAGVSDPSLYSSLASHYRALGRTADADAAMGHAAMLMSRQQPPAPVPMPVYQQPQPIYYPQAVPVPQQSIIVNNVVNMGATGGGHPPMIVRLIYFLFIGWWFGFFWIALALGTFPFIVTIPLGIWMLNRTGRAFFL